MRTPIVLLDCDGPLFDFARGYLRALNSIVPGDYKKSMQDRWAMHECDFFKEAADRGKMKVSELKGRVAELVAKRGFAAKLKPHPKAIRAVARLRDLAWVYAVTSPWDSSPTWQHERLHSVYEHFGIPRRNVIQTASKERVHGHVFVDDKTDNANVWGAEWPDGTAFLFDMGHNRKAEPSLFYRRGGWPEIIAEVERRAREG